MSDLTASHCDCGNDNNGCCTSLIWLIILLCICGNNGNGCGRGSCGSGFFGNNNGCGCESIIFILLILCCCGGNSCC